MFLFDGGEGVKTERSRNVKPEESIQTSPYSRCEGYQASSLNLLIIPPALNHC